MSTRRDRKARLRAELWPAQQGRCFWCRIEMTHPEPDGTGRQRATTATLDHYPIAKRDGGRLRRGNVVLACASCNHKRDMSKRWHLRMASALRQRLREAAEPPAGGA